MNDEPSQSPSPADAAPEPRRRNSPWWWVWFWRICLVASPFIVWYFYYVPSNDIAWADDFASAQQQATESGKPAILFFTAEWCVPCRIMKRTVWADDQVEATVNAEFVPAMIYVDDPDAADALERYTIGGTPTTIITDPQGNVLEQVVGGMDKSEFLKLLEKTNPSAAALAP